MENVYNSIVPSEMTEDELHNMVKDIIKAIDRGLPHAKVRLAKLNLRYRMETPRLKDYRAELSNRLNNI